MFRFYRNVNKFYAEYGSFALGALLATGITISALPETILLNKKRNIFAYLDEDKKEKSIDKKLDERIEKILFKIYLRPEEEASLDYFLSVSSDPIHYGSLKMRTGAIIGFPLSLEYKEGHSFKGETFSFQGIPLNIDEDQQTNASESLRDLKKSLVLTSASKDFLIAREINYTNSHHIHVLTAIKATIGVGTYTAYYLFDTRLKAVTSRLKGWVKFGIFSMMSCVGFLFYLSIKDAYNCFLDYLVDKETAQLGKEYAQGGVDYYNSILTRNKALRNISKSGSNLFTPFGNEVSTFRTKHLQLTYRRDNLVKLLNAYDDNSTKNDQKKNSKSNV